MTATATPPTVTPEKARAFLLSALKDNAKTADARGYNDWQAAELSRLGFDSVEAFHASDLKDEIKVRFYSLAVATMVKDPDYWFKALCDALPKSSDPDAQRRIRAHVAAAFGRSLPLPVLHHDQTISDACKIALYKTCMDAVKTGNWTLLRGKLGAGDSKIEPATPIVPPLPATVVPEPAASVDEVYEQAAASPEVEIIDNPISQPKPRAMTPATPDNEDPLFKLLAERMNRHVHGSVDAKAVEEIVNKLLGKLDIHDQITKAVGNGSFPTDRVQKLIDAAIDERISLRKDRYKINNPPASSLDGLLNQIKMIANHMSAGELSEAQIGIIDLIDDLSSTGIKFSRKD